jgi:hypothetical protein
MSTEAVVDIVNVINIYPIAVDTLTWNLFDLVFTDDVTADFGGAAKWSDLTSFKEVFAVIHAPFESTQHVTTNHQVVVDGERASCLSYVHGRFIRTVPEGGNMFESGGWYDDQLVRTNQGWRISNRVCRMQWWTGNPAVLETMPGIKVEQVLNSLRGEAAAGTIAHLKNLQNAPR